MHTPEKRKYTPILSHFVHDNFKDSRLSIVSLDSGGLVDQLGDHFHGLGVLPRQHRDNPFIECLILKKGFCCGGFPLYSQYSWNLIYIE